MLILLAMSYGEKIKEVRKRELMTQEVFAERIGVSRSVLSQIEIGRINPTAETLRSIARQFGVSLDYLVMDEAPLTDEQEYPDMDEEITRIHEDRAGEYARTLPNLYKVHHHSPPAETRYRQRSEMNEIPLVSRRGWQSLGGFDLARPDAELFIRLPVPSSPKMFAVELAAESNSTWLHYPLAIISPMDKQQLSTGDQILFARRDLLVYGKVQYVDARGWVMDGTMYMNREIHTIWRLLDVIGLRMD